MCSTRGQAATEYVGALLLIAAVLTGAAAAGPFDTIGRSVVAKFRHGLCVVANGVCTTAEARAEGLAACTTRSRSNSEEAGASLGLIRLARGDALAIEQRSDGRASVSFLDGWKAGAETGIGVRFSPLSLAGEARAGGGLAFTGGRTWDFGSWAEAADFVARHARHETLTGEVKGAICFLCDDGGPPPAHATFTEGGVYAHAALDAGLKLASRDAGLDAEIGAAAVIGRRRAGARHTTYLKVSGESAGRLGAVIGSLGTDGAAEVVLEVTSERGRPVELRAIAAGELGVQVEAFGANADLGRVAERLRAASAGAGRGAGIAAEATLSLDLHDPANLEAARGVLANLASPVALGANMAALGSRLDSDGSLTLQLSRAGVERSETALDVSLVQRFGGSYERVERGRQLLAAWTSVGGGPLREREDCAAATALAEQA